MVLFFNEEKLGLVMSALHFWGSANRGNLGKVPQDNKLQQKFLRGGHIDHDGTHPWMLASREARARAHKQPTLLEPRGKSAKEMCRTTNTKEKKKGEKKQFRHTAATHSIKHVFVGYVNKTNRKKKKRKEKGSLTHKSIAVTLMQG